MSFIDVMRQRRCSPSYLRWSAPPVRRLSWVRAMVASSLPVFHDFHDLRDLPSAPGHFGSCSVSYTLPRIQPSVSYRHCRLQRSPNESNPAGPAYS